MPVVDRVLQLKISLLGVSKPPVWRRVLVPPTMPLDRLHDVIQAAMGWTDTHMHEFTAGGVDYGPRDPELDLVDERKARVGDLLGQPKDRMRYTYDFGDHWQHDVVVEKVLPAEAGVRYPRCVAGKGRRPPEDCGGVWGYRDLRARSSPTRLTKSMQARWTGSGSTARRTSMPRCSTPTRSTRCSDAKANASLTAAPPKRWRLVRRGSYAPHVPWDDDWGFDRFAAIDDAEELCRQLLASPGGWGSSTRHLEAAELLERLAGTSELPGSFVALMVCTCRRWDRVTARLIAAIEDSGLLDAAGLDELADAFLCHEHVISYPLTWVSPQWLDVELGAHTGRVYTVDEHTLGHHRPSFEPPLRRWAACRVLRAEPERLDDLLCSARAFAPRHRDALVHGLLDAAEALDERCQRNLVRRGLESAQASVRRTALDRLCELDGPDVAARRARADTNAAVRRWRPREAELTAPSLFGS